MTCTHDCNQGRQCVCATHPSMDTLQADIDAGFDTWDEIYMRVCVTGIVAFASMSIGMFLLAMAISH